MAAAAAAAVVGVGAAGGTDATGVEWTTVSSIRTTASAPSGMGAPVMIRTAVPCTSGAGSPGRAATSPTMGSEAGASDVAAARSAALTAKPSIWELRNSGRSTGECTAREVTRPRASSIEMLSERRVRASANNCEMWAACSSTDVPCELCDSCEPFISSAPWWGQPVSPKHRCRPRGAGCDRTH